MWEEIKRKIDDAELILAGIGEEFDGQSVLGGNVQWNDMEEELTARNEAWMLPILRYTALREQNSGITEALVRLKAVLQGKNYFLISTCTSGILETMGFIEERIVLPCGSFYKKQCPDGCAEGLQDITDDERDLLISWIQQRNDRQISIGRCPHCGRELVLNNVYYEKYDENGYMEAWSRYTKWLQGTLNRKLCILELGVNLDYPSVIRFPFEKAGFYNQKAVLIRVNERLYQLPENMGGRGISIAKNSIDWLLDYVI